MTTFQLVIVGGPIVPGLMIAGFLAALLPLVVLVFIRRRSKQMTWGAMWLVQESLRKQSPLKVLRALLFLIRSSLLPLTAIALIGFWFNSSETHHNQQHVVILDDAIGAWETGADGQCAMDSHIKTIGLMQSQTNQPIHIVLLSGRSVSSADVLHTLKPISSGPNWELATHKAKQLVDQHEIKQIVLLSELRNGVLQSFSGEFIPGVVNSFTPPR